MYVDSNSHPGPDSLCSLPACRVGTSSHAWEGAPAPPAGMFDLVPPFHTLLILFRIPVSGICIMKVRGELGAERGNCLHWGVWAGSLADSMSSLALSGPISISSCSCTPFRGGQWHGGHFCSFFSRCLWGGASRHMGACRISLVWKMGRISRERCV